MRVLIKRTFRYTLDGSKELEARPGDRPDLPEKTARYAIRHKYAVNEFQKIAPENKVLEPPVNKVLRKKRRRKSTNEAASD